MRQLRLVGLLTLGRLGESVEQVRELFDEKVRERGGHLLVDGEFQFALCMLDLSDSLSVSSQNRGRALGPGGMFRGGTASRRKRGEKSPIRISAGKCRVADCSSDPFDRRGVRKQLRKALPSATTDFRSLANRVDNVVRDRLRNGDQLR